MAANYEMMPLDKQLAIMTQEVKNTNMLEAKSIMWGTAAAEFAKAGKEMGQQADKIEPKWKDAAGRGFVAHARNTKRVFDKWHHNITSAKPDQLLKQLSELIPQTYLKVVAQKKAFEDWYALNAQLFAAQGISKEEAEVYPPAHFRHGSGAMMNKVADLYGRAAKAVDTASSGGKYEGLTSKLDGPGTKGTGGTTTGGGGTGGGGGGSTGVNTTGVDTTGRRLSGADTTDDFLRQLTYDQVPLDPKTGFPIDPKTGLPIDPKTGLPIDPRTGLPFDPKAGPVDPRTGLPLGVETVEPASIPGLGATDPALSGGLGSAPVTTPTPPPPAGVGTTLPNGLGSGGGLSLIPPGPAGTAGLRPAGLGTGGLSPIPPLTGLSTAGTSGLVPPSAGSGGLKLPGVSLGGGGVGGVGGAGVVSGNTSIPAAAAPVQAPSSPAPSGGAPVGAQPVSTTGGGPSAAGPGGMPPMMPPGGMGGAGGAGVPGSGGGSRPGNNGRNRRKEGTTPGLPVMLSGKAGRPDMVAFAGRGRNQHAESDVPTTVQLIDEDLWQVEQKAATPVERTDVRRAY